MSSAAADVANGKAAVTAAEKTFDAAEVGLRQAEANDLKAQDDVTRYKPLAEKDEIPQHGLNTEKAAAAGVESARASASAAEQTIAQARSKLEQIEAQLRYAETGPQQVSAQRSRARAAKAEMKRAAATLEQAQLNMQYTTIVAPV